ncbi:D-alanyl-D-alanine carboxypeptidase (penicillin-binding protein 5/6) [Neisseria sp. HSC-16F19]|nr:D-alanyl-D-alanine carboxypeptidase family protein [Neisseria sp. HSC-16F19]MCP2041386.1 D-alanyl-D-alanine carboxypeptidase (penicillin-binding protein 5/6) [Neisseria sp. HSC-16F19]
MKLKHTLLSLSLAACLGAAFANTPAPAAASQADAAAASAPAAPAATAAVPQPPQIQAAAYIVEDAQSGQVLAAYGEENQVEPASLTKLMTAYLTFKALEEGRLKLEQTFTVSDQGWRSEGSRMFLDPKKPASVDDLLKGLIVQSGNDAAITLAEAVAGSEAAFVDQMNAEALRLGMTQTRFTNSTGLPGEQHYTSVTDLVLLAKAIIRDYPQYYPIYSVKSFRYNNIDQPNRNLLLYRDPSVDGLKTGHTSSAGYNLVASSNRNGRRVISVVVGTESPEARAAESSKLLNWALQSFETPKLYNGNEAIAEIKVYKGSSSLVRVGFLEDAYLTLPVGSAKDLQPVLETVQPVVAPIQKGRELGTLKLMSGNTVVAERTVVALDEVAESGWFGRMWDSIVLWFKNLFS